ncbi:MAG: flagellar export chaperone FliS [Phycisphaerae bacterium]
MAVPSQEYLKTKVMTASPEMLTLMLWDGAIRFAEQAKEAIRKKEIEGSFKALVRSQKIITELSTALNRSVNPDLCGKLAALYNFIYRRLVEANITKDEKLVDDALEIMRHQRETWVMLMDKLAKEKAGEAQPIVAANADAVASAEEVPAATSAMPTNLPKVPAPAAAAGAPARRGYPAFAVRPVAVPAGSISVQG